MYTYHNHIHLEIRYREILFTCSILVRQLSHRTGYTFALLLVGELVVVTGNASPAAALLLTAGLEILQTSVYCDICQNRIDVSFAETRWKKRTCGGVEYNSCSDVDLTSAETERDSYRI